MDLSIIIPSFNTKTLLDRCLASVFAALKNAPFTAEVIVVDNASTDGSIDILNKKYTQVKKILNKTNIGYGKANNIAIRHSAGDYILLLNSDTVVLDEALVKLYECAQAHPGSFIGGRLLNEDLTRQSSCGPFPDIPVVFLMLYCKGDVLGFTRQSPDTAAGTDWVSGACLFGAKKTFLDVGLFDETIFMYMEEVDLLYRGRQKGYTTLFCPDARFIHTGAASSGTRRQPVVQIYRGLLYFYRKHRSIMEQRVLRILLLGKARISILIGKIVRSDYLVSTYEEALRLVH